MLHFHRSTNGKFTLKSCFTFHSKGRTQAGAESQVSYGVAILQKWTQMTFHFSRLKYGLIYLMYLILI